jgi:phosphatidate cytidylyltransferase
MASVLRQRVLTALLLGAAVVALIALLPPAGAVPVIGLVFLAGAWEWAGFAGLEKGATRWGYVAAVGLCMLLAWHFTPDEARLSTLMWLAVAWWVAAALWLALGARRGGRRVAALAGFAVLVPAAVALGRLALMGAQGPLLLFFLVVLVAAADVGAFFGGRRFGRHKLAPFVSPGKTWEGLFCGMLAAAGVAALGGLLLGQPLAWWVSVSVAVALVSVVGDLVESMFKRRAGLKDSGHLLPGHGGVLDRIDSLTAAGPAFLLALNSTGFVP